MAPNHTKVLRDAIERTKSFKPLDRVIMEGAMRRTTSFKPLTKVLADLSRESKDK